MVSWESLLRIQSFSIQMILEVKPNNREPFLHISFFIDLFVIYNSVLNSLTVVVARTSISMFCTTAVIGAEWEKLFLILSHSWVLYLSFNAAHINSSFCME